MIKINPKYNIGDKVYILNRTLNIAYGEIKGIIVYPENYSYLIDDDEEYYGLEYSEEKVFDSEESCRNALYKSLKTYFR